jgi:hypothetical protein
MGSLQGALNSLQETLTRDVQGPPAKARRQPQRHPCDECY